MTDTTKDGSVILWQTDPEDAIAEPALLIEPYSDTIRIGQKEQAINVNYESVDELIKVLRNMLKNRK